MVERSAPSPEMDATSAAQLYDLPAVIDGARGPIVDAGLTDRCTLVGGDFFAAVPGGADAYLLKNVIHDWDDGQATQSTAKLLCGDGEWRPGPSDRALPSGS